MASRLVQVPPERISALRKLAEHVSKSDTYPRIDQVVRATTKRFYWRGIFEAYFDTGRMNWGFPDGSDGDQPLHYSINVFQQYGRGFISQVGIVPRIRFDSRKIQNPAIAPLATKAEDYRKDIESANDVEELSAKVARLFWTDGPVLLYVRQVRDPRFGSDEEGKPQVGPRIDAFGILEAKMPINIRDLRDFPQLQISIEIDANQACALLKTDRPPGITAPGDNMFDRTSRLAVTQGTRLLAPASDTGENMPTWQRTWVRPAVYRVASKDDRDWLAHEFPEGAYISYIGDKFHEARTETMDDCFSTAYPLDADGQSTPAAGDQMLDPQDLLNDTTDLWAETLFKAIPAIYGDKGLIDFASISKQDAGPGAHYPTKRELTPDDAMADHFWAEPMVEFPASGLALHQALLTGIPQGLTGLYPAVLGDTDPASKTKGGLLAIRDASRGQQGPAWKSWRKAYKQAILLAVRSCFEQENDAAAPEFMQYGKDICLQGDETFPMTDIEKRESFQELISSADNGNQQAMAILSDPQNAEIVKRMIDLPDLRIPGLDESEKQMAEIAELLEQTPIPDPGGQPVPLRPSIGIDPDFDNHAVELQRGTDWINSAEGQQAKAENPEGFTNVKLHLLLHKTAMGNAQQSNEKKQFMATAALESIKHPKPAPKPPSISLSGKIGPAATTEALAEVGIDGTPDELSVPSVPPVAVQ